MSSLEGWRAGDMMHLALPQVWAEVLVDCPGVEAPYTYAVNSQMAIALGDVVLVPFGDRLVGGLVVRVLAECPDDLDPARIRSIHEVVAQSFFQAHYWDLLERTANYYHVPLTQVLRAALPPGLLRRSQRRIRALRGAQPILRSQAAQRIWPLLQKNLETGYSWRYLCQQHPQAPQGLRELLQAGCVESYICLGKSAQAKQQLAITLVQRLPGLTQRQAAIVAQLQQSGGEAWLQTFQQQTGASRGLLDRLTELGCVAIAPKERLRSGIQTTDVEADQPRVLTPAQAAALAQIQKADAGETLLLHGVTGSGKTEVYLQAIAPFLDQQRSVLVLVPEIGLTPQLTERFQQRFGRDRLCLYHSGLSDGERYDAWRQMLLGGARVVIGTRSAVFAPLPNLGLIILDEEHDSSFKQEQTAPCYHARQVAQWRSQLEGCPLLLGSATPALETWATTQGTESQTHYLQLPDRVEARSLPPIEIVDLRQELANGNRSIFSTKLQQALIDLQQRGEQGILFIHRRGHSTFVSCRACGTAIGCPHCDVSLSYHLDQILDQSLLRCHYCNYTQAQPQRCPVCDSPYLKNFGSGSQRVEAEVKRLFPELTVFRYDSDTTRQKGGHQKVLDQFRSQPASLLVGTQMLTKGIDLPQVTVVGVVAADGLLHMPDFRASERSLQTLIQVAGRAGRGDRPGRVIVQTYSPDHPVLQHLADHNYSQFLSEELQERQAHGYPPAQRLLLLSCSGLDEDAVIQAAEAIADHLREQALESVEILGPAPANIARIARRHRWQILLKSPPDRDWNWLKPDQLRSFCRKGVSLLIDVDPISF
ncbi:primosomal protein N' [Synechococcus elongatus IITB4]|uniref:primosomal protein N' n=1 Tax=Synechococcus elongatus TaxID=32046 RepID=UPI0030D613DA